MMTHQLQFQALTKMKKLTNHDMIKYSFIFFYFIFSLSAIYKYICKELFFEADKPRLASSLLFFWSALRARLLADLSKCCCSCSCRCGCYYVFTRLLWYSPFL